jgi:Asp-tRNA(Asn)/Glu-tRNA(Gln) amidotransferase A subunit family amidase
MLIVPFALNVSLRLTNDVAVVSYIFYLQVTARCTEPTKNLLQGRTVALKDNIALAGVRCTNGTAMVDWVPEIDATVATRVMDAGGIITGKAGERLLLPRVASCSN